MTPGDELPHVPGDDPGWAEWWHFDFGAAPDGPGDTPTGEARLGLGAPSLVGFVRLCLRPHEGTARYWASLAGEGRSLVVVHDDEVPQPRNGSLEIRTDGLWADHVVEAPFEQVGVGCEAFGLRLDSPADLQRSPVVGDRVPFGLDLEWASVPGPDGGLEVRAETEPGAEPGTGRSGRSSPQSGYRIACQVYGEVLVAEERIQLDAPGSRSHMWGTGPPPLVP